MFPYCCVAEKFLLCSAFICFSSHHHAALTIIINDDDGGET